MFVDFDRKKEAIRKQSNFRNGVVVLRYAVRG